MQTSSLRFKKHPKGVFIITRMQTSSIYEKISATEWTCLCFLIRKSMKELSGMEGSPKRDVPIQVLIGNVHQNVWTWQEFLDQHQTPLHSLMDYCRKPAAQIKRNDLTESVGENCADLFLCSEIIIKFLKNAMNQLSKCMKTYTSKTETFKILPSILILKYY